MAVLSLKVRAIVLAVIAGGIAFALALASLTGGWGAGSVSGDALIMAIVCGSLSWAAAHRTVGRTAEALDSAIARLVRGADGDLSSPVPPEVLSSAPRLAGALDTLFARQDAALSAVTRLALHDPVTDLPNRTNFRRACDQLLIDLAGCAGGALLFIDLDRFKQVNDSLGHALGDRLLAQVARRLQQVAGAAGAALDSFPPLVGRLAGDEFTIFLPGVRHPAEAAEVGQRILAALQAPFDLEGHPASIGASIGIAMFPLHGTSLTELMRAADVAMYRAKSLGRGRVEGFTEALAAELAERGRLERDLHAAVGEGQFALAFQPQVRAADGQLVAAEALLRWHHPQGIKLPGSFLPRAEETGQIVEIGEWVVGAVASTIARWQRLGIEQRLGVNVSARQLDHAQFFRRLREALHAQGASANLLELEIASAVAQRCSDEVIDAVAALRADGATVALDDFGTGWSSLPRLRRLPIDRIKLHASVIEHVTDDAGARAVAQALVALVHGLGCQAVAEGIETVQQADVLRAMGCDLLQGYAVAEPMDEARFLSWAAAGGKARLAG